MYTCKAKGGEGCGEGDVASAGKDQEKLPATQDDARCLRQAFGWSHSLFLVPPMTLSTPASPVLWVVMRPPRILGQMGRCTRLDPARKKTNFAAAGPAQGPCRSCFGPLHETRTGQVCPATRLALAKSPLEVNMTAGGP